MIVENNISNNPDSVNFLKICRVDNPRQILPLFDQTPIKLQNGETREMAAPTGNPETIFIGMRKFISITCSEHTNVGVTSTLPTLLYEFSFGPEANSIMNITFIPIDPPVGDSIRSALIIYFPKPIKRSLTNQSTKTEDLLKPRINFIAS